MKTNISISLDEKLIENLKEKSAKVQRTLSSYINLALSNYIKDKEKIKNKKLVRRTK